MSQFPAFINAIVKDLTNRQTLENLEAAIILGSGLSSFAEQIEQPEIIPYAEIPQMPQTSVAGHEGNLIFGTINGQEVIAFSGRFHHYEGFDFEETATPVYLAKALGAQKLIISNAAGAINTSFSVGDLMVIEDVIRGNSLITPTGKKRHRYRHHQWVPEVRDLASQMGITTQQGTYFFAKGPNYETKAEIRAFRRMGGDAVGMSTAPELFEAARLELKTTAISLISNMAAGVTKGKLNHEEVKAAADSRKDDFARLVKALIANF
ncbi:purine-nucleoside phosphorylase [Fodinibius salsisoli]|uniref:Purine nucleoside phosphorylase n=1 Tax=Fodinibius salsisoli TaxID=2820877 RepID=A0ABT3PJE5_9BACT|nr:purine-nucleoside phosphorylase [Fodinibius salsisoli]MCW9705898.1 purine-nucleoside phosphorylase [Fodinibius salsisoli]